jgi:hypothetical protein
MRLADITRSTEVLGKGQTGGVCSKREFMSSQVGTAGRLTQRRRAMGKGGDLTSTS